MPTAQGTSKPGMVQTLWRKRWALGEMDAPRWAHRYRAGLLNSKVPNIEWQANICLSGTHISCAPRSTYANQDQTSWFRFLEGKALKESCLIQELHCAASHCHMNGADHSLPKCQITTFGSPIIRYNIDYADGPTERSGCRLDWTFYLSSCPHFTLSMGL